MKKTLKMGLLVLACWCVSPVVWAESSDFAWGKTTENKTVFQETEVELPEVPSPENGEWLNIYVNETQSTQPFILLDNLSVQPDKSIRFILNQRSASGHNNISAEGVRCSDGWFNSDGILHKTFAYADLSQQRWIPSRNAQWQARGSKRNAQSPFYQVLYDSLCVKQRINNVKQLREALIKNAHPSRERSNVKKFDF